MGLCLEVLGKQFKKEKVTFKKGGGNIIDEVVLSRRIILKLAENSLEVWNFFTTLA